MEEVLLEYKEEEFVAEVEDVCGAVGRVTLSGLGRVGGRDMLVMDRLELLLCHASVLEDRRESKSKDASFLVPLLLVAPALFMNDDEDVLVIPDVVAAFGVNLKLLSVETVGCVVATTVVCVVTTSSWTGPLLLKNFLLLYVTTGGLSTPPPPDVALLLLVSPPLLLLVVVLWVEMEVVVMEGSGYCWDDGDVCGGESLE